MKKIIALLGIFVLLLAIGIVSCKSTDKITEDNQTPMLTQHNGPQLWGNNCVRCHNSPSPDAYSDHAWIAIVNHMQKVSGITVSEANQILEFLQASN